MDAVTYDVIGNQGPKYEVIMKGRSGVHNEIKTPPINAGKGKEFTLSECPTYDPVSTSGPPAEYEVVQTTSQM